MVKNIRNWIISFLVSRLGAIVIAGINAAVAYGVAKLAQINPALSWQVDESAVATFIWGLLMTIINYATNKWLTQDAKAIQQSLVKVGAKLKIDGWIGDETVREFEMQTGIKVERARAVDDKLNEEVNKKLGLKGR